MIFAASVVGATSPLPQHARSSTDLTALAVVAKRRRHGKVQSLPLRRDAETRVLAFSVGASAQRRGGLPSRNIPVWWRQGFPTRADSTPFMSFGPRLKITSERACVPVGH